jgi:endoglucanase
MKNAEAGFRRLAPARTLGLLLSFARVAFAGPSESAARGGGPPQLRGANVDQDCSLRDLEDLRALGANQVRWHLSWRYYKEDISKYGDKAAYDSWLEDAIARAREAALVCERLDMLMVVDLASPPGDRVAGSWTSGVLADRALAERLLDAWELIARRLADLKAVYAFEIVNEPVLPAGLPESAWRDLFLRAAKRIRAVDPDRVLVYDVIPWDNPSAFIDLKPLPIDRVLYTLHMYMPEKLTAQYLEGLPSLPYPGPFQLAADEFTALRAAEGVAHPADWNAYISGKHERYWDGETLRLVLKPVLDFQKRTNSAIYVGEFSCVRWAPGDSAYHYLRDCIALFDEYGWDWSYHIWRSSDVWDAEKGTDKADQRRSEAPTDRVRLLESAFAKNERPGL